MPNLYPDRPPLHRSERELAVLLDRHLPDALWVSNVYLEDLVEVDFLLWSPRHACLWLIEAKTFAGVTRLSGTQVQRAHQGDALEKLLERAKRLAGAVKPWSVRGLLLATAPNARVEIDPDPQSQAAGKQLAVASSWLAWAGSLPERPDSASRRAEAEALLRRLTRRPRSSLGELLGWSVPGDWPEFVDGRWVRLEGAVCGERRGVMYVTQSDPEPVLSRVRELERQRAETGWVPLSVVALPARELYAVVEEEPVYPLLSQWQGDRALLARTAAHQLGQLIREGLWLDPAEFRVAPGPRLSLAGLDRLAGLGLTGVGKSAPEARASYAEVVLGLVGRAPGRAFLRKLRRDTFAAQLLALLEHPEAGRFALPEAVRSRMLAPERLGGQGTLACPTVAVSDVSGVAHFWAPPGWHVSGVKPARRSPGAQLFSVPRPSHGLLLHAPSEGRSYVHTGGEHKAASPVRLAEPPALRPFVLGDDFLLVGGTEEGLLAWQHGRVLWERPLGPVRRLVLSPGRELVLAALEGALVLLCAGTGALLRQWELSGEATALAVSVCGSCVAVAGASSEGLVSVPAGAQALQVSDDGEVRYLLGEEGAVAGFSGGAWIAGPSALVRWDAVTDTRTSYPPVAAERLETDVRGEVLLSVHGGTARWQAGGRDLARFEKVTGARLSADGQGLLLTGKDSLEAYACSGGPGWQPLRPDVYLAIDASDLGPDRGRDLQRVRHWLREQSGWECSLHGVLYAGACRVESDLRSLAEALEPAGCTSDPAAALATLERLGAGRPQRHALGSRLVWVLPRWDERHAELGRVDWVGTRIAVSLAEPVAEAGGWDVYSGEDALERLGQRLARELG